MVNNNKNAYATKLEKKQEVERRYRQNQKNKFITESNEFTFDDFILFVILTLTVVLCDVIGFAF